MNPPVGVATRVPTHHRDLRPLDPAGTSSLASPNGADQGVLTILVAEDDHSCRSALLQYFERSGYRVTEAADGPSTLRAVFQHSVSLVILDLGLPGFDGTDVLAKIRRHSAVPIIVCSGRDSEDDRIRTLNLGADDFVVKPFSFAELEARVRAVLRRGNGEPAATCLHHGDLVVDRDTRTVTVRDNAVPMTRKEFDLLAFLAASPGQVFSREDLLERVWGSTEEWQGRSTVTEHVRRVRLKIEPDPDSPSWITTVRGVGYRFTLPDNS
jgi:two-component system, OmpR family, phosphate regulon response regulator PhoB